MDTHLLCYVSNLLEAHAQADAEAEGDVVAAVSEHVPQGKAVVVAGLGGSAESGSCTCPSIDEEAPVVGLVAGSGQQGAHAGQGALASEVLAIVIGGVDDFGAQVEALEAVALVACYEELVAVAQGVAAGLVAKLVEAGTDEAGTYLARLMVAQHTLVRQLGATP